MAKHLKDFVKDYPKLKNITDIDEFMASLSQETRMSLAQIVAQLVPEEQEIILSEADQDILIHDWNFWGRPSQIPPDDDSWSVFAMVAGRGAGKALSVDTPVPTPTGWTTMGDLKDGDQVFGSDGSVCTVVKAHDAYTAPAYRVEFSDGTNVEADGDHQWSVWSRADRRAGRPRRVVTTSEMLSKMTIGGERNWRAPVAGPLELPEKLLPIDPWTLGFWLGDGSSASAAVTVGDKDYDEIKSLFVSRGMELSTGRRKDKAACATYTVGAKPFVRNSLGQMSANESLHSALREANLLNNKHIPQEYFRASRDQREDLLAGLIDSDGYVSSKGYVEITVCNQSLSQDIEELIRTLGHRVTRVSSPAKLYGRQVGTRYRISYTIRKGGGLLTRKQVSRVGLGQADRLTTRMVDNIAPVGVKLMRCITVDSYDSCYLAGKDLLVTHNTRAGSEWVHKMAMENPGCRIGLVARTAADARDVMVTGDSGIMSVGHPDQRPEYLATRRLLKWPNGSIAQTFSSEEPDQLRGPQFNFAWADEAAAWKHSIDDSGLSTWDNLEFATRLPNKGRPPQKFITTTPKRTKFMFDLIDREKNEKGVIISRGSTMENSGNLDARYIERIQALYAGTRLAEQELYGLMLDEVDGALWSDDLINDHRVYENPHPPLMIIAVDPSMAENPKDECGIIVAGATNHRKLTDRHCYIIEDMSIMGSPTVWAEQVVKAWKKYQCPVIVEKNQGKALVDATIHAIDPNVPVLEVWAYQGKKLRAEPVTLKYDQGRVHHLDYLPELESQLVSWVPGETKKSPDRLDALVYAVTALLIKPPSKLGQRKVRAKSLANRRLPDSRLGR